MCVKFYKTAFLRTAAFLWVLLVAGCTPPGGDLESDPSTLPPPPSTTPGDGEGPGWVLPDNSEQDGDTKLNGGNSLPRPSGDTSSDEPTSSS